MVQTLLDSQVARFQDCQSQSHCGLPAALSMHSLVMRMPQGDQQSIHGQLLLHLPHGYQNGTPYIYQWQFVHTASSVK